MQLADGTFRTVTQKWIEKMQNEGSMKKIEKEIIKVHILDLYTSFQNILNPNIGNSGYYRQAYWVIGTDIPRESVEKFKDPANGELYAYMTVRKDLTGPELYLMNKNLWEETKGKMDAI